nr:MAG TPA: hypothetical protein [Caudoviricetes sp.]
MEKYILTISGWRLLSCRWDVVESLELETFD